tara:strand:- start:2043 stop:3074 length:1032 start_codon:yes stop_codon:yes gene_type:complete
MIKQIVLLLLSGSIFCQDLLTLKNDQEYRGTFDRFELEKVYFIPDGEGIAQSVQVEMVRLLKQGSVTLVKDGQLTLNASDEKSSYIINGVKYVRASDNDVRGIASRIINSSVHHKKPSIIDSPSIIILLGFPISLSLGVNMAPPDQKPESYALPFMSGFIAMGLKQHTKFNNFTMATERDSFLEETSGSDIGIDKRSVIFAEQLGELAAYRSIERHQFHMSSFRRFVTNYAVTMPVVPILINLSPPLILAYPFIFPKIYDRYNQKTYFDKKMKNYLVGLPENEHEVFKSKHDPIVENYKGQKISNIKKKDSQYNLVMAGTISAAGCIAVVALVMSFLSSITFG